MIDIVEESFDVHIRYVPIPCTIRQIHGPCYGMVRAAIGTKSIAVLVESGFTNRFEDLLDALLDDTILDGRNTERTHSSVRFRNFHSAHCVRLKIRKPPSDICDQLVRMLFTHLDDRRVIDSASFASCVLLYGSISQQHIRLAGDDLHELCEAFSLFAFPIKLVELLLNTVILVVSQLLLFPWFSGCHKSAHSIFDLKFCLS